LSPIAPPGNEGNSQPPHQASRNLSSFAPSILAEATGDYFEKSHPSPFMTLAYSVRPEKRDKIPAPTHVDGTGRLQTVTRDANPRYWKLIKAFEDLTRVRWC